VSEERQENIESIQDTVEILSTDDEKIKKLGELLSNDSSRIILKLLFDADMTANQIAQKTDMLLSLVIYHLNKMMEFGIVKINKIEKNQKDHDMKYYTASKLAVLILPSKSVEKAKKSKSLLLSFKRLYKFAAIGISAGISYMISLNLQNTPETRGPGTNGIMTYDSWAIIIALAVIVVGLIVERASSSYNNKNIDYKLKF